MPYNANDQELDVLKFWQDNNIFEKSVENRPAEKPFVFYDGPPFATGLPHYGHIVASAMKDAMPRYQTMRGHRVERRWGWDCHGLPIENIVEKEKGLNGKQEIEALGVDVFNEACRSTVLKYADDWKKIIPRLGRWVDMENDYKTMDKNFMESVWWVFRQLWDNGFVYEGKKPMHICPRCATPLSNFEVTQGYKDIKDLSVTAQFKLAKHALDVEGDVYMLAWTTTPWTLPGNVLLTVGADLEYTLVKSDGAHYVAAKDRLMDVFEGKEFEVVQQFRGKDFVGFTYEPLFDYFQDVEGIDSAYRVITADFVTTDDGTGIVHIAPAFGTDDYEVFREEGVPFIQHVTIDGKFTPEVKDFAGMDVKQKDDHMATDIEIVKWLAHNGKLFSKKKYLHSYPHCWRCDTPLLNYATSSWFVEVTKMKEELLKNNQKINWVPGHIKEGRFGKWLEGVRDWAVSRNRYWGTPLPVWKSEDGDVVCVGSVAELEALTGTTVEDLHKHHVDKLTFEKDGKTYTRIPEVFDCWFESGSMPYGQAHYPFEHKEKFEKEFPADFIAEGADQTRGWFYTLHVLSTGLTSGDNPVIPNGSTSSFQNVVVNGIVLAEDGKKMSKRLKNYPDPMLIAEQYGADALRYYLLSSPVMHAENLNFSEAGVREVFNKVCNTLSNVLAFYSMFADEADAGDDLSNANLSVLDQWILARLHQLVREVTDGMEDYRFAKASRPITEFILDLSQWYVRRSRSRCKQGDCPDQVAAVATMKYVLETLSKVMAPFTPFIAEHVYQEVTGLRFGNVDKSVHLEDWPQVDDRFDDAELLEQMTTVRKMVEMGLSLRKEAGLRVRQPLGAFAVNMTNLPDGLLPLVADELNVKEVVVGLQSGDAWRSKEEGELQVALNTEMTEELKKEGLVREVVRAVNGMRKTQGLTRDDRVVVEYATDDALLQAVFAEFGDELKGAVLADEFVVGDGGEAVELCGMSLSLLVKKV